MKAMGIIDVETTYLMEKCTMIKLLHRIQLSKDTLIKNIEDKNENWWLHKEIKLICERLRIEPEEVCYYPDRTRDKLEEEYYNRALTLTPNPRSHRQTIYSIYAKRILKLLIEK